MKASIFDKLEGLSNRLTEVNALLGEERVRESGNAKGDQWEFHAA